MECNSTTRTRAPLSVVAAVVIALTLARRMPNVAAMGTARRRRDMAQPKRDQAPSKHRSQAWLSHQMQELGGGWVWGKMGERGRGSLRLDEASKRRRSPRPRGCKVKRCAAIRGRPTFPGFREPTCARSLDKAVASAALTAISSPYLTRDECRPFLRPASPQR